MKKVLNTLFLTLLVALSFSACSDVPAPYDILTDGDVPGLTGDGTKENPYTVEDLKAKADGATVAWVQAYIVAGIKSSADMSIKSADDVVFGSQPTGVKATAVLIADGSTESDYQKCSAVNLNGSAVGCSAVKAALNLVDNNTTPLPRLITMRGTLVKNTWGLPGLKDVTAAVLENGTLVGEGGETPEPEGDVLFQEAFTANQGAFTIKDVTLPDGATNVWKWEQYQDKTPYMVASAQVNNVSKASESWLISPIIDMSTSTKASLSFDHAHKFAGDKKTEFLTLWITESGQENWKQLVIPTYSDEANWTFVSSGKIDLAGYVGKKIKFAFKYLSVDGSSAKWEINNVKIVGDGQGGTVPDPDPEPTEGKLIFTEIFGSNVAANILTTSTPVASFTHWDNSYSYSATTADIRAIAHKTPDNMEETVKVNNIWFPATKAADFTIGGINLTGYSKFVVVYEAASNAYQLTETDNLNKLKLTLNGQEVTPPSKEIVGNKIASGIFHEMKVEVSVAGTDNSTLKFSTDGVANTLGLRLYNIRLYGLTAGGGTDPEPSKNLVVNPGFENWTLDLPTAWDNATYNTGIQKETTIVHGGGLSVKQAATATNKVQQEVTIEGGKTYRISYWYLDNTPNAKSRPWIFWLNGTTTLDDHASDLRPTAYSTDNSAWQQFTKTLVAPAAANKLRFEVRTYKEGDNTGFSYFDDFEVVEVIN